MVAGNSDSDQEGGAKRWLGYPCPECSEIFRVPAEGQGKEAECPHCEARVVLGRRDPVEKPMVFKEASILEEDDESLGEGWKRSSQSGRLMKRKVVATAHESEQPDWEGEPADHPTPESGRMYLWLLLGLFALTAGLGLFARTAGLGVLVKNFVESRREVVHSEDELTMEDLGLNIDDSDPPEEVDVSVDTVQVEAVVKRFLEAADVDELLGLARNRSRVEPLMRRYYEKNAYNASGFRRLVMSSEMQIKGDLVSVQVELPDLTRKLIVLERKDDTYIVDWESWVTYGEMGWKELRASRSTKPVLMRVLISNVEYYNFGFSDENKWQSYRLSSDDKQESLYGYIDVNSEVASKMRLLNSVRREMALTIRVRFPEGAKADNQVIIEEVIASGWVLERSHIASTP